MSLTKTLFGPLAVGAIAMLWAGSASAVTFGGTFTVSPIFSVDNGGVKLAASNISPLSLNLTAGVPFQTSSLFTIGITDNNGIDQSPDDNSHANPIGVNFSFTTPTSGSGAITGTTLGYLIIRATNPDTPAHLNVVWNTSPITIAFPSGETLKITLADLIINCPAANNRCNPIGTGGIVTGNVSATFTYEGPDAAPGQTPLPGALSMFVAGLGVFGGMAYRRRNARKLAA